jgi:hypothetical protein
VIGKEILVTHEKFRLPRFAPQPCARPLNTLKTLVRALQLPSSST